MERNEMEDSSRYTELTSWPSFEEVQGQTLCCHKTRRTERPFDDLRGFSGGQQGDNRGRGWFAGVYCQRKGTISAMMDDRSRRRKGVAPIGGRISDVKRGEAILDTQTPRLQTPRTRPLV